MKVIVVVLLCACAAKAQNAFTNPMLSPKIGIAHVEETPRDRHMRTVWFTSIAAMSVGTGLDAYSSWHRPEGNALLASPNGSFGARGIALKTALAGGMLVPQIILRKHKNWHAAFALSNFLEAGVFAGAAAHNLTMK